MVNMHKSQARRLPLPRRLAVVVGLVLILLLVASSLGFAQEDAAFVREVRIIEPDELGLFNPAGLAFSPADNVFYLVSARQPGRSPAAFSDVAVVATTMENQLGTASLLAAIPDPINMAFDGKANRLLLFQPATLEFVELVVGPGGQLDATTPIRHDVRRFGLQDPQGMAVDPSSGRIFLLDNAGPRIVRIDPYVDAGFANAVVTRVDLAPAGLSDLRGLAFNPANGHLYTQSPAQQTLYELTPAGNVVTTWDTSSFALSHSQGMVFAPTGDLTDDPSLTSLYIANSGLSAGLDVSPDRQAPTHTTGYIIELSFDELPPMAINADETAILVQTIDTSQLVPPSPDPAGITYLEPLGSEPVGTLLVSDSEVDEMPMYFTGKNVFEMTLSGSLIRTATTIPFSYEPSGLDYNPANNHLFVADDNAKRIWEISPGPDGLHLTADDPPKTYFTTTAFDPPCNDPEGIAFDSWNGVIFLACGINAEIYRVAPGPDGKFDGVGDVVTHFDTAVLGFTDPGGIAFDTENGYLYVVGRPRTQIAHITTTGSLVRTIGIPSEVDVISPGGLAMAPGSQNPGVMNIYMTDRGIDNGFDEWENDGKIYEFYIPSIQPDVAIHKSVQPAFASAGDIITYTLTFSNAGGGTASGVVITDHIPSEVTVQSVISSGVDIVNSGADPSYVWNVQNLTRADHGVIIVTGELSSTLSCFDPVINMATIATSSSDTRPGNDSSDVTVAVGAGVMVDPPDLATSADQGDNVPYTLWVTNTGTCTDTFHVSVSGTSWSVDVVDTVGPLDPGEGAPVDITVSVPSDALCGPESAIITFTSQGAAGVSASSELVTSVNTVHGITVSPTGAALSGAPGANVIYPLQATNTGNCPAIFDLTTTLPTWITGVPATVGPLLPGLTFGVDVTVTVPSDALFDDQDISTVTFASQGGGAASASSTLVTSVNIVYGLLVDPTSATGAGNPNTGVPYILQVTNTGNHTDTFTISTSSDLWSASTQPTSVELLPPSASADVQVTVAVPQTAQCGAVDHTTATFTSQGNGAISADSLLTTSVNTVRGVSVVPLPPAKSGDPGSEVYYTLYLINEGNCIDTFALSVSNASWGVQLSDTSLELNPGILTSVDVTVTIPSNAQCGDDLATVTVTSQSDPGAIDTTTLTTTANPVYEVRVDPSSPTASGDPGANATYDLQVTNIGNCRETFDFSAAGDDWPASALPTAVTLDPDEFTNVQVSVAVPSGAQCGASDSATVFFTSHNDGSVSDWSLLTTTANHVPAVQVMPASAIGSAKPGLNAVYNLQVTNQGNCQDTFSFSAIGDDWPASAIPSPVTLDAGASAAVDVSVAVPSNALCTDSDIATVTFTSQHEGTVHDSTTLTTSASPVYGVTVGPSSPSSSGNPGADASYTLQVTNIGNCTDTFNFSATGDDWPASALPAAVTLDPAAAADVDVAVAVPSDAMCGDSDIATITFTSQHEGTVHDSSTLTTSANAVSDLIVDPTTASASANPGFDAAYTLWVTNTGNCVDTFAVSALGDTWLATALPTEVELDPDVGAAIAVTVAVPSDAQCGDDVATVTFTSNDGQASASSTLTTSANAVAALTIDPATATDSGNPGDPVTYDLRVTNEGNCQDSFNFSVSGNAWDTSAPGIGPLNPGMYKDVIVTVTVDPDAQCGDQDLAAVTYASQRDGTVLASSDLTTSADTVYGVTVEPSVATLSGIPGTDVTHSLWVTNTGNCQDTFIRSITGDSWPVSSAPIVGPLDPDEGAPVDVTVSVPACTLGGVSDGMTVKFTSQNHGTTADSVALTTSADYVAPVAGDDEYSVQEDQSLAVAVPGVLDNDSDANCESLTASINTLPAHGTVVLDPEGSFAYTPTLNFHGVDTFTYDASDGALSGTGTVTITVTSAGDDPMVDAGPDQGDILEGQEVSFSGSFLDPARQLLFSEETILWNFGDGNTATGVLTPTHTYYDNDVYTVTLTVTDTEGDVGQDLLTVTVLNVAPTVDVGPDRKAEPGDLLTFTGTFTDPGADDHTYQWDIDGTPVDDTLTFDHAFGATGDYSVTLTVTDDDGGVGTDTALVSVRLKVYLPLIFRMYRP